MKLIVVRGRSLTYVQVPDTDLYGLARLRPGDRRNWPLGIAVACVKATYGKATDYDDVLIERLLAEPRVDKQAWVLPDKDVALWMEAIADYRVACRANPQPAGTMTIEVGATFQSHRSVSHAFLAEQFGKRLLDEWKGSDRLRRMRSAIRGAVVE